MPGRAEYAALLNKVDAFSERVAQGQGPWLRCGRGCDGCCRTARSAWAVEIDALCTWLALAPAGLRQRLQARRDAPSVVRRERCIFLDDDGSCAVYPARPIICRTHGPAVRTPEGELTWCALNFADVAPEAVAGLLPAEAILDLDLLDRMLALINARYLTAHDVPARAPLTAALDPQG
ncbi:MAG: YkgJ family cysteine cluster protein [Myxococcales bacterium]|nr:YkgJ family cysteine cluster protein [Myxococcales bacterium]